MMKLNNKQNSQPYLIAATIQLMKAGSVTYLNHVSSCFSDINGRTIYIVDIHKSANQNSVT